MEGRLAGRGKMEGRMEGPYLFTSCTHATDRNIII